METNRQPSGLGRGLAGILGDNSTVAPSEALGRLVGARAVRRSPQVRQLITATALASIADGFNADGVVLVRRDESGELATVTSRLPSGWSTLSPVTFEMVGLLWQHLDRPAAPPHQATVGSHSFLLSGHDDERTGDPTIDHPAVAGSLAVAVVRSTPFADAEVEIVGNLVRSVGAALNGPVVIPSDNAIRVLNQRTADGVLADVRIGVGADRRHAAAVADDVVTATARAASELCDVPMDVTFAGSTEVDDNIVTLVVVTGPGGAPLFGLSVDDRTASTGPAEAVFAAARIIEADPFAQTRHPSD